ncbi:hypothetical protein ERX37_07975 [Macrococcus hajekii]|uniref:Uncharacterized protein n=1 Tax=Macrococcus hajekii TaxID=198482 RepID=A0A4R6BIM4_9STAP|nr:hypothetical protein [Macrococcus hajekii]TDM01430.1 hypothetical protein ERX37_07975 [Macrococcus hajekii]GGA99910.1 hypothetical protein GCM10007190_04950 [Macrococcus hajekii]
MNELVNELQAIKEDSLEENMDEVVEQIINRAKEMAAAGFDQLILRGDASSQDMALRFVASNPEKVVSAIIDKHGLSENRCQVLTRNLVGMKGLIKLNWGAMPNDK